jgi:hypothetical protein
MGLPPAMGWTEENMLATLAFVKESVPVPDERTRTMSLLVLGPKPTTKVELVDPSSSKMCLGIPTVSL